MYLLIFSIIHLLPVMDDGLWSMKASVKQTQLLPIADLQPQIARAVPSQSLEPLTWAMRPTSYVIQYRTTVPLLEPQSEICKNFRWHYKKFELLIAEFMRWQKFSCSVTLCYCTVYGWYLDYLQTHFVLTLGEGGNVVALLLKTAVERNKQYC